MSYLEEHSVIQLYSPDIFHGRQAIIVNDKGRKELIKALEDGKSKKMDALVNDGEGYYLHILVLSNNDIEKYSDPYMDKEFCLELEGKIDPRDPRLTDKLNQPNNQEE